MKNETKKASQGRIDELVRLISLRSNQGQDPYLLFLGAGCSLTSGYMIMEDFMRFALEDLEKKSIPLGELRHVFDDFWRSKSPTERYAIFKSSVRGGNPSEGYLNLVMLIKQNYFNLIFTTNMDSLLEDSLRTMGLFTSSQLLVLVLPEESRDLQSRLLAPSPKVKIVKLHGDAWTAPPCLDRSG